MLVVETIARIRYEFFSRGKKIKQIARELGVVRDTVRKVIRSGATEFIYKRESQPLPKIGLWVSVLSDMQEREEKLPRRERRSTVRLFEELRGRGYDGAHDSVYRFVRSWHSARARAPVQAFIPLRLDPGKAYRFDWSHEGTDFHGLPQTAKVAQMRLSPSRMPFVRAYFRETQEMAFDAHDRALLRHYRNRQRILALQKPRLTVRHDSVLRTPKPPGCETSTISAGRSRRDSTQHKGANIRREMGAEIQRELTALA